jgi:hypothetical protein
MTTVKATLRRKERVMGSAKAASDSLPSKSASPDARKRGYRWVFSLAVALPLAGGATAFAAFSGHDSPAPQFTFAGASASFSSADAQGGSTQATEPGPESTTLKVVTYQQSSSTYCVQVQNSQGPGQSIDPSKPAGNVGNCGTSSVNPGLMDPPSIAPTYGLIYDNEGVLWIAQSGNRYFVAFGRVTPKVARVIYAYPNGSDLSVTVQNDWWALAIPANSFQTGFSQKYLDASGNVLLELNPNGQVCQTGQSCT